MVELIKVPFKRTKGQVIRSSQLFNPVYFKEDGTVECGCHCKSWVETGNCKHIRAAIIIMKSRVDKS